MTCGTCGHEQDRGRFCGRCGARVAGAASMRDAATASGTTPVPERRTPPAWLGVVVALAVLALALSRVLAPSGTDEVVAAAPQGPPDRSAVRATPATPAPVPTAEVPTGRPVFGVETGTVLVFDDGTTGAVVLDLDTGAAERFELPGQRAGDQPFRLWALGGQLVVGWSEIFAVPPRPDAEPRLLGRATLFLPAAEPDELWLVDHAGPSERSSSTWTLIDAAGSVLASVPALPGHQPVRGVPGGLAVRDEDGVLWRYVLATGEVVADFGDVSATWIGDVTRERVAWCSGVPCETLVVSDAAGAEVASLDHDSTFSPDEMWLSPDGSRVAGVVWSAVGNGIDRWLRIWDVQTGILTAQTTLPLGAAYGGWTTDGRQFFAWIHAMDAGGDAPAVLARWDGGPIETTDVGSIAGARGFVPLPRAAVLGGSPGCQESERSDEMGPLPAWRGKHVHLAVPRSAPTDPPAQLWVGIPGAGAGTTVTVSATLVDGSVAADLRGAGSEWQPEVTARSGMRTASGYPPHWAFESRFPVPGCWAVTVTTEEVSETLVLEMRFDGDA